MGESATVFLLGDALHSNCHEVCKLACTAYGPDVSAQAWLWLQGG